MTESTIYADSSDSGLHSFQANGSYSNARAGTGTSLTTYTTAVGQIYAATNNFSVFECFYSFDTSSIPDDDDITSAVLTLYADVVNVNTSFTIEVREYDFGASVTDSDWIAGANLGSYTLLGSISTSSVTNEQYNEISLNVSSINKAGNTRIVLCSSRTRLGNAPSAGATHEIILFYPTEESGTSKDPKLVIEHAPPEVNIDGEEATATSSALLPTISTVQNNSIAGELAEADSAVLEASISSQELVSVSSELAEANAQILDPIIISDIAGIVEPPVGESSASAPTPTHSHDYIVNSEQAEGSSAAPLPSITTEVGASVSAETATATGSGLLATITTVARRGIMNAGNNISRLIISGGSAIRNRVTGGTRRIG